MVGNGRSEWRSGDPFYARQKLRQAVSCFASPSDLKSRLLCAFMACNVLGVEDFPDSLRARFERIYQALTEREAQGGEGKVRATLAVMDDREAWRIADQLIELQQAMDDHCCELRMPNKTEVQAHLEVA